MSSPNLDSRYTKPADVDAKIAAQAVMDAGQYASQAFLKSASRGLTRIQASARGQAIYEPNLDTVLASPPTISATTTTTSIATGTTYAPYGSASNSVINPVFSYVGAPIIQDSLNNRVTSKAFSYSGSARPYAVKVRIASSQFELMQLAGTSANYRVRINGQWVTSSESITASGSGTVYELYNFGSRADREIEVWGRNWKFCGFRVATTDTVRPIIEEGPRVFIQGNSFPEGSSGATSLLSRQALYIPRLLGIPDAFNVAVGGTDFLNNGGGTNGKTTIGARMASDVYANLDGSGRGNVLIQLNSAFNDGAYTTSQVTAAVSAWLQDVKTNAPDMTVILTGLMPVGTPTSLQIALNDAVYAAVSSNWSCLSLWIDPINGIWVTPDGRSGGPGAGYTRWQPSTSYTIGTIIEYGGVVYRVGSTFTSPASFTTSSLTAMGTVSWFFGTGNISSVAGDGNADVCRYSDSTHPTDEGDRVITMNVVSYIRQAAVLDRA